MRRKILDMLWQWKKTENGRLAILKQSFFVDVLR